MRSIAFLAILTLSACTVAAIGDDSPEDDGSSGTDPDFDPDPDPEPGSGSDPDPDPGDTDLCPPSDLGIVDSLKDVLATIDYSDPEDPGSAAWRRLSGIAAPDVELSIDLWDGYGAFADGNAAPGDYPIAGDDTDPGSCGLCIEVEMTVGEVAHRMAASGGSLSLESVIGRLTGSGETISFVEVDDSGNPVEGGCKASIDRVVFDAPLEPYFPD
jgi:hypothetical protein